MNHFGFTQLTEHDIGNTSSANRIQSISSPVCANNVIWMSINMLKDKYATDNRPLQQK